MSGELMGYMIHDHSLMLTNYSLVIISMPTEKLSTHVEHFHMVQIRCVISVLRYTPIFGFLALSLYGSPESLKELQINLHQIKLLCIKQSHSASNKVSCVRVSVSSKVLLHQVKFPFTK